MEDRQTSCRAELSTSPHHQRAPEHRIRATWTARSGRSTQALCASEPRRQA